MGKDKKRVNIWVDSEAWDLAGVILPCSRSQFMNKQLINYIDSIDNIEELKNDIKEIEEDLLSKKEKLKHLVEVKELRSKNKENIETALNTVRKIFFNNGVVTYSQIKFIANRENISEDVLIKECKNNKIKVLKIYEK